ncbi:phosphate transport system permease protein [Pelolinea submarina]|uniref:Phosphate transport system permease protein n=2 Tax=Pelolinea submarina TaxID=913107 RepID=A0A347ZRZ9_9CHLR|nr:phosphate ABC transporter permease subunit PstC [Pelolinea submarina]REG11355.1 phosphate ABC transporter permease protein PstC [Pelolinea submarina]BBB48080.1 phosphate transport system permease protein [Pelolinea submarina]
MKISQNTKTSAVRFLSILFALSAAAALTISLGTYFDFFTLKTTSSPLVILIIGIVTAIISGLVAFGLWKLKNWAKTTISILSVLVIAIFVISEIFSFSTIVFAGESVVPLGTIFATIGLTLLDLLIKSAIPLALIYLLKMLDEVFLEGETQRFFMNQFIQRALTVIATTSILVVVLIFVFTFMESTDAIKNIGLGELLTGTIWRPGAVIGDQTGQFGLVPMVIGSLYSTLGAVLLGVPLSIFTAILLGEIAPHAIREIFRSAIELLAGIPSVIFGLFGMVVLAPLIRNIEINGNSGFGILNASIILAIMILPTITNVAEDAIRAVPNSYREASLAMGATHWQTITTVVLPAARSGIIAAVILGIGRALGETMALIMVIGNSIAIPTPLNDNPFSVLLATARTLTGNIAVEINYAAGVHRSALFFTGILLFLLLLLINRLAHFIMRERQPS